MPTRGCCGYTVSFALLVATALVTPVLVATVLVGTVLVGTVFVADDPAGKVLLALITQAEHDAATAESFRKKYFGPRRKEAGEAVAYEPAATRSAYSGFFSM